jgi:hypothetical protein
VNGTPKFTTFEIRCGGLGNKCVAHVSCLMNAESKRGTSSGNQDDIPCTCRQCSSCARMAELFNAMVGADETWAESLSARLSQGALMHGDSALLQEFVSQLLLPQPGGYMTGSLDLAPGHEDRPGRGLCAVRKRFGSSTSRHRVRSAARSRPAGCARQSHGASDTAGHRGRRPDLRSLKFLWATSASIVASNR